MKTLIAFLIFCVSFFSFSQVDAACKDGTRSSSAGLSPQSNGCYKDDAGLEYSIASSSSTSVSSSSAWPDTSDKSNILWLDEKKLRTGDVTMDDIPKVIVYMITFLLGVAGTISILALIYHAVKMQLASGITGDSSWVDKAKSWMKWAMIGFVVSLLAWFIVTRFVDILSSIS
jgi:hypothetical protein